MRESKVSVREKEEDEEMIEEGLINGNSIPNIDMHADDRIKNPGQPSNIGINPDFNMDVSAIMSITGDAELAEKFNIWEKELNDMKKCKR